MLSSSTLTCRAYLSQSFRVRRLAAAVAFFILLSGAAQAQTYFSGTPQTIDNGVNDGGVGSYDSQAIVNGNPAISYYDGTNRDLKYVRANDAEDGDLTADMTFTYLDPADVNGNENNYKVFRRAGGFTTQITPNSHDSDANTATVMNVSSFSDWGIGALTPSAALVNIGGRVVSQDGTGVPGAQVTMVNQAGAARIARTSPFGYYRFENVEAGQTYFISASAKRYRFPVRVVNVGEDLADLDFMAQ